MRRDGGSVFRAHANTGDPKWPDRGLSGKRERTRADIHDGPEHNTLQSEAGYIDARPLTASSAKPLATHGRTIHWVKKSKFRGDQATASPGGSASQPGPAIGIVRPRGQCLQQRDPCRPTIAKHAGSTAASGWLRSRFLSHSRIATRSRRNAALTNASKKLVALCRRVEPRPAPPSPPCSIQRAASRKPKSANENRKSKIPNMLKACRRAVPAQSPALRRTHKPMSGGHVVNACSTARHRCHCVRVPTADTGCPLTGKDRKSWQPVKMTAMTKSEER